jgi:acyl transferase domain-containing protein
MSFDDALRLVTARGRLMAAAAHGAMLAVSLPEAELLPLLEQCGADLAAVNGPRQCVASGTEAQIASLSQQVAALGKSMHRLPVSHAFHSALMEPVLDDFAAEVARTPLSAPTIPIVSNLSGEWLKPDEATDPAYWVRHLRGTVRFATSLRRLIEDDPACLLVEAGPGSALTRLARGAGVAKTCAITTQPLETKDGHTAFLDALGQLWVAGVPVNRLAAAGNSYRRVPLPGYPFERIRLWIEPGAVTIPDRISLSVKGNQPLTMSDTEEMIAAVWRDVLGVPAVGPDDDFLAMGGDSLIAVRIATRLRERLGCEVAANALFRGGTVAGLARLLGAGPPAEQTGNMGQDEIREEGWL